MEGQEKTQVLSLWPGLPLTTSTLKVVRPGDSGLIELFMGFYCGGFQGIKHDEKYKKTQITNKENNILKKTLHFQSCYNETILLLQFAIYEELK